MAFATVTRTSQVFNDINATSWTITLPAVTSGQLILVFAGAESGGFQNVVGWTEIFISKANDGVFSIFAKVSDGTESSLLLTGRSDGQGPESTLVAITYVVSSWGGTLATDIDYVVAKGLSNTPASVSVTAGWGAADNLVLSFCGAADDGVAFTAFPSGYTNTFQLSTSVSRDDGVEAAACELEVTTASATAGTYSLPETEAWGVALLIIKPGTSGATGPNTPINPSVTNLLATSARLNWEQG